MHICFVKLSTVVAAPGILRVSAVIQGHLQCSKSKCYQPTLTQSGHTSCGAVSSTRSLCHRMVMV